MTDATQTPGDLEAELKDQLRWLCSIFGQPSDLLRGLAIKDWRRLRTWVQGVEALAARLVRALAAALTPSSATAQQAPTVRAERIAPDTDYPDSARWIGICFRFRDDAARSASPRLAATQAGGVERAWSAVQAAPSEIVRGFRSARRLALRLEAVIRVAENAARYAERLARRRVRPPRRKAAARGRRIAPTLGVARIAAPGPPLRPPDIETG